jgi:hypothetical protein
VKSRVFVFFIGASLLIATAAAGASSIDMNDPYRAVGREYDLRVDAQLLSEIVRPGSPIAITYQIQNFSDVAVAVAEKMCSATYDADSQTIHVSIGSEIPLDGEMPRMALIAPGEKKIFTTSTTLTTSSSQVRATRSEPRYLQIKVNVLRDLVPFRALIEKQVQSAKAHRLALSDDQFDHWFDANRTIFLNALPVRFEHRVDARFDASRPNGYGSP